MCDVGCERGYKGVPPYPLYVTPPTRLNPAPPTRPPHPARLSPPRPAQHAAKRILAVAVYNHYRWALRSPSHASRSLRATYVAHLNRHT